MMPRIMKEDRFLGENRPILPASFDVMVLLILLMLISAGQKQTNIIITEKTSNFTVLPAEAATRL
jgi:hypothetical protein